MAKNFKLPSTKKSKTQSYCPCCQKTTTGTLAVVRDGETIPIEYIYKRDDRESLFDEIAVDLYANSIRR